MPDVGRPRGAFERSDRCLGGDVIGDRNYVGQPGFVGRQRVQFEILQTDPELAPVEIAIGRLTRSGEGRDGASGNLLGSVAIIRGEGIKHRFVPHPIF